MAMTVEDLQNWLDTLENDVQVGVDDGGLTLRVVGDEETYCEVGGLPDDDEYDA